MRSRHGAFTLRYPPRAGRPHGFTLAESVVALVLLACGAAALAAASAGSIRALTSAEAEERAAIAARNRVEQLAARGCSSLDGGGAAVDSSAGLRERWTVAPMRNGVRLVTDSVDHLGAAVGRPIVLHRIVLC